MKRTCARVQGRLPRVVDGTSAGWQRRLILRHVGACEACASELERQRMVAAGLRELRGAAPGSEPDPPEDLLDEILERVHDPGIRERVAAPARGAVSGARPGLSLATLLFSLLLLYLIGRAVRLIVDGLTEPVDDDPVG